jgi:hypothetical protein
MTNFVTGLRRGELAAVRWEVLALVGARKAKSRDPWRELADISKDVFDLVPTGTGWGAGSGRVDRAQATKTGTVINFQKPGKFLTVPLISDFSYLLA